MVYSKVIGRNRKSVEMIKINPQQAEEYFRDSFNCAESTLLAYADAAGIQSPLIPSIASAIGAGISRTGQVCGAVTGSLLVIGLLCGRRKAGDSNDFAYYYGWLFMEKFREKHSSIHCRDLTGQDFNDEKAWESYDYKTYCSPLVRNAVEILNEIMGELDSIRR